MSEPTQNIDAPFPSARFSVWNFLALLSIIGLAVFLLFHDLQFRPHFDELWHMELSTGRGSLHLTEVRDVLLPAAPDLTSLRDAPSLWRIPGSLSTVTHPPLYPILLRLWRDVFGESLPTARTFSAILSLLSLLMLFDSVRLAHQIATALWAALLFAVASAQLETAQQVRNYGCEVFFVICTINATLRIERRGPGAGRIAFLALGCLGAFFSHYFALFALGPIGLYALIRFRGRARISVLATLLGSYALFLGVWWPMLSAQRAAILDATINSPLREVSPTRFADEATRLCLTPIRLLFEPRPPTALAPRFSVVLLIIPWLLVRKRPALLLWALVLDGVIGSVVLMDIVRHTKHLTEIRHVLVGGIGMYVLIPLLVEHSRPWLRHGVPAVVAVACLAALGLPIQNEWRHYAELARLAADPRYRSEPILFYGDSNQLWRTDTDWLAIGYFSHTFPRPILRADRPLDDAMVDQLRRWPGAVLVCDDWQIQSPDLQRFAKMETLGFEPYLADVAHLTWLAKPSTNPSTTQPVTSATR